MATIPRVDPNELDRSQEPISNPVTSRFHEMCRSAYNFDQQLTVQRALLEASEAAKPTKSEISQSRYGRFAHDATVGYAAAAGEAPSTVNQAPQSQQLSKAEAAQANYGSFVTDASLTVDSAKEAVRQAIEGHIQ